MKLTPYWLDTATPSGDYRRNPVPEEADIAIVGAGFTGLSAALEAARHGANVVVLDSQTVGWGAAALALLASIGRNLGEVRTQIPVSPLRTALREVRQPIARILGG